MHDSRDRLAFTEQTELPLVGRVADLGALRIGLDDALEGRGGTIILSGEGGIGKTRLVQTIVRDALQQQMMVAVGAAYAIEAGMPYGMIADALVPAVHNLPSSTLAVLARGAEHELATILHGLSLAETKGAMPLVAESDRKARLFWQFAQFLGRMCEKQPLLLVLENAHWSDPSSMELVHFLARQLHGARCLLIVTYADDEQEPPPHLARTERSLVSRGDASVRKLRGITRHDVADVLHRLFALPGEALAPLADRLHDRARGNPLFVDQLIRHLVESSQLSYDGQRWVLANVDDIGLPASIRDALRARLVEVDPTARRLAEAAAVIGTRTSLTLLQGVGRLDASAFADAIDALCAKRILRELREGAVPQYEFVHPLMQLTVLDSITAARRRALHHTTAEVMERSYGTGALAHAPEIAAHLVAGHALEGDPRALRFVAAAGRDALERHADAEALQLLRDALAIADSLAPGDRDDATYRSLLEDLARARQRCGDRDGALALLHRAISLATEQGDLTARARLLRRLGLSLGFSGNPELGLTHLDDAEATARAAERRDLVVRTRVAKGILLQSLGRSDEAKAAIEEVLPVAQESGDRRLQAQAHRALMQLYGFTGPIDVAREHGKAALRFAQDSEERVIQWWAHWGMAVLEGLGGNAESVAHHQQHADAIATELRSPMHQLLVAEIAVEYASGVGEWNEGLRRAERSIPLARAIAPATVLPRMLVWTGLVLIERDEVERGHQFLEEAWELSRAEEVQASLDRGETPAAAEVHNVILAHTGMAALALSREEWRRALDFGRQGLAIADRFGYVVWAIHRLMPLILEAGLWLQEFEVVREVASRFREQSTLMGHRLGLAWANAADALRVRLEDRRPEFIPPVLAAADQLDAIPFPFHAARLRRRAAQLMAVDGELDGARREIRRAHDVFVRLGAERQLRGTRSDMRTMGIRLPARRTTDGAHSLTGRELDIARLVALRKTNKEIAVHLDISARTVSTHLSNMFGKLDVDSRGALVDLLRSFPGFVEAPTTR